MHVIDHEGIRARLRGRFNDLGLALTGKWLKENGVGQTTVRNFLDKSNNSITLDTVSKLAGPLKTSERWLIFGASEQLSEDVLQEMVEEAIAEIEVGMSIGQIRSAVASALREQIRLHLAVGATQSISDETPSLDIGVQSPSPTKRGGREGSRNS